LVVPILLVFGSYPLHEVLLSSLLIDLIIAVVLSYFYMKQSTIDIDGINGVKLGIVAGIVVLTSALFAALQIYFIGQT